MQDRLGEAQVISPPVPLLLCEHIQRIVLNQRSVLKSATTGLASHCDFLSIRGGNMLAFLDNPCDALCGVLSEREARKR